MGYWFFLFLLLAYLPLILAQEIANATIVIDGGRAVAETDDNFVCATVDWWPHDKCNYNQCPWGYSSAINLNLSHPLLAKAVQAFTHLRIRIGGSLQDQVLYGVPSLKTPCHPFWKKKDGLFGFSSGCLDLDRWDALNNFFQRTGVIVSFGLNALYGRKKSKSSAWVGAWDSTNAHDFIKYTISKGYMINSWEFGNELSGSGVGASVDVVQYGKDLIKLKGIINQLYQKSQSKVSILAPGGFYDQNWYTKLLQVTGSGVVNALTHHIYNLGPGRYLDQLGLASTSNTKVYCRQTLVGGNYGLLNPNTFVPNPDYYSALLWERLMGKRVLSVGSNASPFLRSYVHCSKALAGVTLMLINLSKQTSFILKVNTANQNLHIADAMIRDEDSLIRSLKKTVSWIGSKASDSRLHREEYHLSPRDGYIQSPTMLLNGRRLEVSDEGDIPSLEPVVVNVNSPIYISPMSIAFIVFPNFDAPACEY